MKREKFYTVDKGESHEHLSELFGGIYSRLEFAELQESSLLMDEWSKEHCFTKSVGGMEEWAKEEASFDLVVTDEFFTVQLVHS